MATLREIQMCQLGILKDVADFCEKYDIKYYLAYGTLLGAVRHKGFIPWDDDIDILMEYSDLMRFKKLFIKEMSEQYFFQDYKTDPGYIMLFPKIRKNNTYMPGNDNQSSIHQGVWIDIFPMISFTENEYDRHKMIESLFDFQKSLANYGGYKNQYTKNLISKTEKVFYTVYYKIKCLHLSNKILKLRDTSSHKYLPLINLFWEDYSEKKYNSIINKRLLDSHWFENVKLYDFEDYAFYSVFEYDSFLKLAFGDNYMIPIKYSHISDYSNVRI